MLGLVFLPQFLHIYEVYMDKKNEFHKDMNKPRPLLVDPYFLSALIGELSVDCVKAATVKNADIPYIPAFEGIPYLHAGFIAEMARVLAYGAQKYGIDNWKKAPESEARDIYLNALIRHVLAYAKGHQHNYVECQYHMAQIAVNAMFLFYFDRIGKTDEPADV